MSIQTAAATSVAFKEWAVTVRALGRGEQVVLVRKGGIREEGKEFRIEEPRFLLYPTYEHQRLDLLQPRWQADLQALLAQPPAPDTVRLDYWAEVTDIYETFEQRDVEALAPLYIFTANYAEERLRWRPKKPLYVLLLRTWRLAAPVALPVLSTYGGCKSWVDLAAPVSLEGITPVLDDAAYEGQRARVRAALGR